jgi:hypothetical protein
MKYINKQRPVLVTMLNTIVVIIFSNQETCDKAINTYTPKRNMLSNKYIMN